jgi:hypothetical protein
MGRLAIAFECCVLAAKGEDDIAEDEVDPDGVAVIGAIEVGADLAMAIEEDGGAIVIGTIPFSPNPPEEMLIIPVPLDRFPMTPIVDPPKFTGPLLPMDVRKEPVDFPFAPRPPLLLLLLLLLLESMLFAPALLLLSILLLDDPPLAVLPLRFRFLMTSVLRLRGRTTPCSFKNNPHALHRGSPSGSRRHRGVVPVPQLVHEVDNAVDGVADSAGVSFFAESSDFVSGKVVVSVGLAVAGGEALVELSFSLAAL